MMLENRGQSPTNAPTPPLDQPSRSATMRPLHKHLLALLILTVVPGMKTIAKAQTLSGLPSCARPALLAAFQASGCKATDATCLCSSPKLFASLQSAIENACNAADQAAVVAFGETYCGIRSTMTGMPMPTTTPVLPHEIPTGTASASYHKTMTYSTTATATSTSATGGAAETGLSLAALAVAVGGMGWLFAEL